MKVSTFTNKERTRTAEVFGDYPEYFIVLEEADKEKEIINMYNSSLNYVEDVCENYVEGRISQKDLK